MVVGEAVLVTKGLDKCLAFSRVGSTWVGFRWSIETVSLGPLRAIVNVCAREDTKGSIVIKGG